MKQGAVDLNYPPHTLIPQSEELLPRVQQFWMCSLHHCAAQPSNNKLNSVSISFVCCLYTQLTVASSLRSGTSSQCLGPYAALHNSTAYIAQTRGRIKFPFLCDGTVSCTFWKHSLASSVFPCLEHSLLVCEGKTLVVSRAAFLVARHLKRSSLAVGNSCRILCCKQGTLRRPGSEEHCEVQWTKWLHHVLAIHTSHYTHKATKCTPEHIVRTFP